MTPSMSAAVRPARSRASRAAATPISQRIEGSSLDRSGIRGTMRAGSRMPALSTTWRLRMPEAFSMKAALDSGWGARLPWAACSAFHWPAHWLKDATSSSLEMLSGGV